MIIITKRGSRYLYRGNTVTRLSELPMVDNDDQPLHDYHLIQEEVLEATIPEIGRSWHFATPTAICHTSAVVGFDFEAVPD